MTEEQLQRVVKRLEFPAGWEAFLPGPGEGPDHAPEGAACFFVAQVDVGLRFPVPSFLAEVSNTFRMSLGQLCPNAMTLLLSYAVLTSYTGVATGPMEFRDEFIMRMNNYGFYYITPRVKPAFLGLPESPRDWDTRYFFVRPFSEGWGRPMYTAWRSRPSSVAKTQLMDISSESEAHRKILQRYLCTAVELCSGFLLSYFGLIPQHVPLERPIDEIMRQYRVTRRPPPAHAEENSPERRTPPCRRRKPRSGAAAGYHQAGGRSTWGHPPPVYRADRQLDPPARASYKRSPHRKRHREVRRSLSPLVDEQTVHASKGKGPLHPPAGRQDQGRRSKERFIPPATGTSFAVPTSGRLTASSQHLPDQDDSIFFDSQGDLGLRLLKGLPTATDRDFMAGLSREALPARAALYLAQEHPSFHLFLSLPL